MRNMPYESQGRSKPEDNHEQDMEMAHYLVPGMESLSEGIVTQQQSK